MASDKKTLWRKLGSHFDEAVQRVKEKLQLTQDVARRVEALAGELQARGHKMGDLKVRFLTQDGKEDGLPEAHPGFYIFLPEDTTKRPTYHVGIFDNGDKKEYRLSRWKKTLNGFDAVGVCGDPDSLVEMVEEALLGHVRTSELAAKVARVKGGKLELK